MAQHHGHGRSTLPLSLLNKQKEGILIQMRLVGLCRLGRPWCAVVVAAVSMLPLMAQTSLAFATGHYGMSKFGRKHCRTIHVGSLLPFEMRASSRLSGGSLVDGDGPGVGCVLAVSTLISSSPALAYDSSDYASEAVQGAIQSLQQAKGNLEQTFKAYESINDIITEGKGVGGAINYKGVQLERGYVADEDTSIYNPGLSLLTESEKERLVDALMDSRKAGIAANQWNEDNQLAFDALRMGLDPLHLTELRGYLGILPIYGAVVYLAVLGVQQVARGFFPIAYIIGALAVFGPAVALLAIGPQ